MPGSNRRVRRPGDGFYRREAKALGPNLHGGRLAGGLAAWTSSTFPPITSSLRLRKRTESSLIFPLSKKLYGCWSHAKAAGGRGSPFHSVLDEDVARARLVGYDDFLRQPVNGDRMIERIKAAGGGAAQRVPALRRIS